MITHITYAEDSKRVPNLAALFPQHLLSLSNANPSENTAISQTMSPKFKK